MKKITQILIFILLSTLYAERGDLISAQLLDSRSVGNNQTYIDNEISSTVTGQFTLDPVQYGYSLFKITYETAS